MFCLRCCVVYQILLTFVSSNDTLVCSVDAVNSKQENLNGCTHHTGSKLETAIFNRISFDCLIQMLKFLYWRQTSTG